MVVEEGESWIVMRTYAEENVRKGLDGRIYNLGTTGMRCCQELLRNFVFPHPRR